MPRDEASPQAGQDRPKVSVLMSVYNDERFVGRAIESVLAQSYQDFELVIVDDGSTDGTPQILARYAQGDRRIRVLSQANAGTTAAANLGLSQCRGEYVARLDSDDIALPHRLEVEVDFLDRHPEVALVGGGSEIIDLQGNVIGLRNIKVSRPEKALRHRCIYQQSDVMFRRDVVVALGGYREKFHNAQDYDLWLRISDVAGVAKLTDVIGQWRLNGGGYTVARAREQAVECKVIQRFAAQRRKDGADGYGDFVPPPPAAHRQDVSGTEYELRAARILLQALRPVEAREKIRACLDRDRSLRSRGLYLLTFLPKPALCLLLAAGHSWMNRFH